MKHPRFRITPRAAPVLAVAAVLLLTAAEPAPLLPVLNEKVLAYARAKLGTSVGDGVLRRLRQRRPAMAGSAR